MIAARAWVLIAIAAIVLAAGFLIGRAVYRPDAAAWQLRVDSAIASGRADSVAAEQFMAQRDSALERAAIAEEQLAATIAAYDALRSRGPRVIRIPAPRVETARSGGAAVPLPDSIDVVPIEEHRALERACDRLRGDCVTALAVKDTALRAANAAGERWRARGDSLQRALVELPPPVKDSRWGFGAAAGYGAVSSRGMVCTGPGGAAGLTFSFR